MAKFRCLLVSSRKYAPVSLAAWHFQTSTASSRSPAPRLTARGNTAGFRASQMRSHSGRVGREGDVRVEVLYVADCPSHARAVEMLAGVLAEEGITAEIHQVLVTDETMARELRFRGSPTIRVEGRDVECEAAERATFAVCCRLYHGSPQVGVPPVAMLLRALREARRQRGER
jgi:hypothetical protein